MVFSSGLTHYDIDIMSSAKMHDELMDKADISSFAHAEKADVLMDCSSAALRYLLL